MDASPTPSSTSSQSTRRRGLGSRRRWPDPSPYPLNVATKEDLKQLATKEDLKQLATKQDLERFVTRGHFDAGGVVHVDPRPVLRLHSPRPAPVVHALHPGRRTPARQGDSQVGRDGPL